MSQHMVLATWHEIAAQQASKHLVFKTATKKESQLQNYIVDIMYTTNKTFNSLIRYCSGYSYCYRRIQ